jgi:hypothetical protein
MRRRTWGSPRERREADAFYVDLMARQLRGWPRGGGWYGREADEAEAAPVTLPAGFRMGVWVDVGGLNLGRHGSDHVSRLQALGITDVSLMINSYTDRAFGFGSMSQARIRAFAALLSGTALRITLTSWLRPERAFIDDLVRDLPPFAQELGARGLEFDVEEVWTRRAVDGFATHDEAAEHLFRGLRAASVPEIAVNCQVDQIDRPRLGALVRNADIVIPQAYGSSTHAVGSVYGPRGLQRRAAEKVAAVAAGKAIVMGLYAHKRNRFAGHSAREIMTMELEETVALRATHRILGARYWSWKWIAGFDGQLGHPAHRYGSEFLHDVAHP